MSESLAISQGYPIGLGLNNKKVINKKKIVKRIRRHYIDNKKFMSALIKGSVTAAAFIVLGAILALVAYTLFMGAPHISKDLFALHYTSTNASLTPALINTLIVLVLSISVSSILGVGTAIYLTQYSKKSNPFIKIIETVTVTLAGIPSIIYGLTGFMIFTLALKMHFSLLAGSLTLAIMILPTIMKTAKEALEEVAQDAKDASDALGANKFYTLTHITLPMAKNGIVNGIILASGRVLGESAALIYTAGTVAKVPSSIFGAGRTLSIHLYSLWAEGLQVEAAYATSAILILLCLVINLLSRTIFKKKDK